MARKIALETRSEPALFTLFGISCHLKDYRLSYLLNGKLDLGLVKMEDFRDFSFYYFPHEDCFNAYYLLSNRGQNEILLPEFKQTDFVLLVEGPFRKSQKEKLLESIRSIPNILTVFEIRFNTLKNYETLLTDLEIHFMNISRELKSRYSPLKK